MKILTGLLSVKVSMEGSLIVSDILKKSKELKQSVFSHVFLSLIER